MCFDDDSRPPIVPIAGGASDGHIVELGADDGNRLAAFRARPTRSEGAGVVVLPGVVAYQIWSYVVFRRRVASGRGTPAPSRTPAGVR